MTNDYQSQGFEKTLTTANEQIAAAVRVTPVKDRPLYRSWIRYSTGGYVWYWTLK